MGRFRLDAFFNLPYNYLFVSANPKYTVRRSFYWFIYFRGCVMMMIIMMLCMVGFSIQSGL